MSLDIIEFAHHYQGLGMNDAQQQAHFETFADLMECIVRAFWQDGTSTNRLGISLEGDTLALVSALDSDHSRIFTFNEAARRKTPGKKEL